jgi:DNA repair protein RadC
MPFMPPDHHLTIHDMPDADRPRERLLTSGAASLSMAELLAIILGTGTKQENVLQLATRILSESGGLNGLARISAAELQRIKGLGNARISQILAALEIGKRLNALPVDERQRIQSAADAVRIVQDMAYLTQEQVRVILLDSSRRVLAIPTIYMGTVNMSIVRVAEVYREAITRNSPALVFIHNHPSGDPQPSPEDVEITRTLIAAGKLLDIQLLDHIIIGQQAWVSLREMGLAFND